MASMTVTPATDADESCERSPRVAPSLPFVEEPSAVAPMDARELSRQFLARLSELDEGTREYQYVRHTLIEMNLSLVRYAASRFRGSGEEREDVVQVGTIGLIKAIDRFEVEREVEFTSFAVPYIVGEIKRFFRDTKWSVHVPRRLQEARIQLARAGEELSSRLGRRPTDAELAELMCLTEGEVTEARKAANGYCSSSLDSLLSPADTQGPGEDGSLYEVLGEDDYALELVEDFQTLAPLIEQLDDRDRLVLHLRFVEERTQEEIGEEIGVSQMQVSRVLRRIIGGLRQGLMATD